MRVTQIIIFIFIIILLYGCYNPFFPETGTPSSSTYVVMDTPYKTISSLEETYENKDYAFFRDSLLLQVHPTEKTKFFRYYVEKKNSDELDLEKMTSTVELKNENVPYGEYLYIEYSDEVRLHQNLFDSENEILFTAPLSVSNIDYLFADSTSTYTTEAYVHTVKNSIQISSSVILQYYNKPVAEFDISEQVFHMFRGSDNQWRIFEWFELN